MKGSNGKPKYSDPALRAAVLYAVHKQDLDPNADLIKLLPKGPLFNDYQRVLTELITAGLILNKSGMHITPLGKEVIFEKALSPLALDFPRSPVKSRLRRVLRWFVFRKSQGLKSNPLDWIATAIMYTAVFLMVVFAMDTVASATETIEKVFKLLTVGLNAIGTTYIAAGVIYFKPNYQLKSLADLQEHFAQALSDASRHCILGIIFILFSIVIDQNIIHELINHLFELPIAGKK